MPHGEHTAVLGSTLCLSFCLSLCTSALYPVVPLRSTFCTSTFHPLYFYVLPCSTSTFHLCTSTFHPLYFYVLPSILLCSTICTSTFHPVVLLRHFFFSTTKGTPEHCSKQDRSFDEDSTSSTHPKWEEIWCHNWLQGRESSSSMLAGGMHN